MVAKGSKFFNRYLTRVRSFISVNASELCIRIYQSQDWRKIFQRLSFSLNYELWQMWHLTELCSIEINKEKTIIITEMNGNACEDTFEVVFTLERVGLKSL